MEPPQSRGGWRTAKACGPNGGNCVEVNLSRAGIVAVRDTKQWKGAVALVFDAATWAGFLGAAHTGRFDLPEI